MMGVVTADTDTDRLTSHADGDNSEQASSAAEVVDDTKTNSPACASISTTTRRRRFVKVVASAALFLLLLMLSGGFCVWTVMKLRRIEERLKLLERGGPPADSYIVGPPRDVDYFVPHLPVCTVVITPYRDSHFAAV